MGLRISGNWRVGLLTVSVALLLIGLGLRQVLVAADTSALRLSSLGAALVCLAIGFAITLRGDRGDEAGGNGR